MAAKKTVIGSTVLALALAGGAGAAQAQENSALERLSAHVEFSMFDLDGFSDNGAMIVVGGGYALTDKWSVKADYGFGIQDAENTVRVGTTTNNRRLDQELDLSQIRGYVQRDFVFGESDFGALLRTGIARLDGSFSVSGDESIGSSSVDADNTGAMFGAGLTWTPNEAQGFHFTMDLPSSDVTTYSAGYIHRF